ncbi:Pectin lyase fold/virulence factor [Penicillium italicum]|uniref:Pectin lyase fold/virulence factor n=1 Tax=Penicillium italicum TaxID=40296 RepID=A0A0A2KQ00_PENIT|nr:Pectin lyase fold/virulence factor [Penicillium italicum]
MTRQRFPPLFSSIFLLCIYFLSISGQYIQTYNVRRRLPNGREIREWQPTSLDPFRTIIDINPWAVYLEYNCYYMTAICRNANDFYSSTRGQVRGRSNTLFHYDFHTTTKNRPNGRSGKRRGKSCPTNWVAANNCPHSDQEPVWRNDGQWWTTALAPPPDGLKFILAPLTSGTSTTQSGISYSCDEFPAASWIEGGDGTGVVNNGPAGGASQKRCAAIACRSGAKAEQNWQATAHRFLRLELSRIIGQQGIWPPGGTQMQVAGFYFRMTNSANNVPARVIGYNASTMDRERQVSQAKRDEQRTPEEFRHWANTVTIEELEKLTSGTLSQHVIYANESIPVIHGNDGEEQCDENDRGWRPSFWSSCSAASKITNLRERNFAENTQHGDMLSPNPVQKREFTVTHAPLVSNVTISAIERAREIVDKAIEESSRLNAIRLVNPLRKRYKPKPGTVTDFFRSTRDNGEDSSLVHTLLNITEEIAAAAALVAEDDARQHHHSATRELWKATAAATQSGSYWMEHIARKGSVPWGDDPSYKVYRNVVDYGAVGDGVTDDTKAINKAMQDGKRCGEKCNGSTTKNAIIYFPPGRYLVSTTIEMPFGTQVIGDANDRPTLIASKRFIGLGVLSTDKYTGAGKGIDGGDQEWFVNTANFYRQLRNIRIDVTDTRPSQKVACLHYQVAQATSIQNVELVAKSGTGQMGIFAENGSGGVISDITFTGGGYGIYGGNQQFTAQRLTFNGCDVGVQIIWDWGWVWKSITMKNVKTGFKLLQEEKKQTSATKKRDGKSSPGGHIGSISVIDSSFEGVGTAVLIAPPNSKPGSGSTGVVIESVSFSGVEKAVADTSGATLLAPSTMVEHWALGPVYSSKAARSFSQGAKISGFQRDADLTDENGHYFERQKPQYENYAFGDFVHVKDFGAKGDGVADDTAALQAALFASQGKILFVDAGSYILTGTVVVPIGSKIVGETWSQLVASGKYFADASQPKVMLKVGNLNDVGSIEMQDLIFTSRGPAPGLIMVEWNVHASSPGAAGLWDCHARVGGATGTALTPKECPPSKSGINEGCNAASLMMHITPRASGYFENMWLWVADHMIDDPDLNDANNDMVQTSIYVARGILIESQSPVWLYGTSSEHSVFYQYNFYNTKKLFAGMIQTESPYYQPTPNPPAPFKGAVGVLPGDPSYKCAADDELSGCDESWGVIIKGSEDVFIASAGIYSWFSTYTQDCIDTQTCQKVLVLLEENFENVRIQNLITIGAKYVAVQDGKGIKAANNLNVDSHPQWTQISVFDVSHSAPGFEDLTWIDPKIWLLETPSFTCSVPCTVKIPPWTAATRIVDYPLITVSSGTWTSTITKPPLTITDLVFEPVTIQDSSKKGKEKRQDLEPFFPVPATTSAWPQVKYSGPDGKESLASPAGPFPTPPPSIGPDVKPPTSGHWPKSGIQPARGIDTSPKVKRCSYHDLTCYPQPWMFGEIPFGKVGASGDDGDDWDGSDLAAEEMVSCPLTSIQPKPSPPSTSSTTTSSTSSTSSLPEPSPRTGDPRLNSRHCYNSGYAADHERLDNAINSYCNRLFDRGPLLGVPFSLEEKFPFSGNPWPLVVVISLKVLNKCSWVNRWPARASSFIERGNNITGIEKRDVIQGKELCSKYLHAVIDSCNCRGVNGKQGGTLKNDCYEWRIDPNTDW